MGTMVTREEIELSFVSAGWEIADLSSQHLLVGHSGDLSILAYGSAIATDDPEFELVDRRWASTYWVRVVPTPRQASLLLEEHGGPPEEQRGNPFGGK